MNRGFEGRPIFRAQADKKFFLEILNKVQALNRVRILAYCVMDNHYHVVLQNESGRMSGFFKQLNGQYAIHYRRRHGGKGYLFQDRYKSLLIQDEAYLKVAIAYVLHNPVTAGLAGTFSDYPWSSGRLYFSKEPCAAVDREFVEELFGSRAKMARFMAKTDLAELCTVRSELGMIIGNKDALPRMTELAERRSGRESRERRRARDNHFEPVEKVFQEFEKRHRIKIADLDVHTFPGKRLRAELLFQLRERSGLTYREIAKLDTFSDLEFSSLGGIYRRAYLDQPERAL